MILVSPPVRADEAFESLQPDQVISSFRVGAVYENAQGTAMGARFRHIPSGFVLDILRIQSVAQAFMWVNSPPPSDQGEPHTCEHLLLGKGTKGRYVASLEDMSLGNSSAFTMQLQTCYHFHTAAGADVFYNLLEAKLDAMLHPNFSDEEIRREVCNIGYSIDPTDSTLHLEEKGTVYAEMVSGYERPWSNLGFALGRMLYGAGHPLANESGGLPSALRTMTPDDLRAFHGRTHHLSNMGMITSLPDAFGLTDFLTRTAAILERVEPDTTPGDDPATLEERLPPPRPATTGEIRLVSYPHQNPEEPGLLVYGWIPDLALDNNEGYMLELLVDNLASGQTSNLYKKFIDSQTRTIDVGANSVFGWMSSDPGFPVYIGLNNISREATTENMVDSIRTMILDEIRRIADFADGSEELEVFNERARSRVIERRRSLRKFLNSPPGFGFRGTSARWLGHLKHMQRSDGFRKRLTLDDELAFAENLLSRKTNIWRDYIERWHLVSRPPFGVAARANPDMMRESEEKRAARIEAFITGLQNKYGGVTRDQALARYRDEYDANTAVIDANAAAIAMPRFVDDPPLTLDDQLHYEKTTLSDDIPLVASTFDNMTSATVGLAFDMNVVTEADLPYVSVLPTLLTEVGVIKDGTPIPFDEMENALRREILGLQTYYSVNFRTERVELVVRGSGSDLSESKVALDWMDAILFAPDWRTENLPRIRDAIDLSLKGLRNRMRGSEESWVNDPANAYWRQTNPLLMSADCFLTQAHAFHRLRWKLKDATTDAGREFFDFMGGLAVAGSRAPREQTEALLNALLGEDGAPAVTGNNAESVLRDFETLSPEARTLAEDALGDLRLTRTDIPDGSFGRDWTYLCRQMAADLQEPPEQALGTIRNLVSRIRQSDNVRVFVISNSANQNALRPRLEKILTRLGRETSSPRNQRGIPRIVARLQEREPDLERPVFVGLVNPNTRSGVHINTAPCASYMDHDRETLLKFLSARLYGGGGAHSMFMKTWGAGLAYSNGLRSNESTGRMIYYAERCPDLAQTMQFVVDQLKSAPYDTSLAQYAIAQAFAGYRGGSRYERRGESIAADLADGVTPDVVRRFRQGVLALRDSRDLYAELHNRMEYTYGEVLPGYGPPASAAAEALYFVIGPESQFESYEEYLRSVEGDVILHRLYPRDYWLIDAGIE